MIAPEAVCACAAPCRTRTPAALAALLAADTVGPASTINTPTALPVVLALAVAVAKRMRLALACAPLTLDEEPAAVRTRSPDTEDPDAALALAAAKQTRTAKAELPEVVAEAAPALVVKFADAAAPLTVEAKAAPSTYFVSPYSEVP